VMLRAEGVLRCIVSMVEAVSVRLNEQGVDVGIEVPGILNEECIRVCPSGEFFDFAIIVGCLWKAQQPLQLILWVIV
jgi:hypothetical protein